MSAAVCAGLVLAASSSAQPPGPEGLGSPSEPAARRLVVTVVTRNDRGNVYCALWNGPEGYPTERRLAVGRARDVRLRGQRGRCVFEGVEPGAQYAVAAFHDENGNDDLDRGVFGIPTEGTGASNDARGFMGPPRWEHARFVLPDVREHRITIRIGYG